MPASSPFSHGSGESGLVSVLTPSFNQARWLNDNLRSVARQTYRSIEHIVMDGGSSDGSVEILAGAAPSVVWESSADAGQSDAINRAFDRSSGEFIGWLNSDDAYYTRNAVADAVRIFAAHPDVGVVYGHAALVNAGGEMLYVLWSPPFRRSLLRRYNFIYQPTVFVRRSVIRRPWFVDPACDYMMDRELWLHLSDVTKFRRLDTIVAVDRHHLERKSYTRLDIARRDFGLIRSRYRLPRLASSGPWQRAMKVALRIAGLGRLNQARIGSDAIGINLPSLGTLVLRQAGQLRRWMPSGD